MYFFAQWVKLLICQSDTDREIPDQLVFVLLLFEFLIART